MPDTLPETAAGSSGYVDDYLSKLTVLLKAIDRDQVAGLVNILHELWRRGGRLVMCGNGGSGSSASHLVCDFQKNILLDGGKPFEVVALTDSAALILAWGNDTDFANVFAGQARTWLRNGDVLLAISGSGNSANVLAAVDVAREVGATTIGFCGYEGGQLAGRVDHPVVARFPNMQLVEDVHMILGHVLFSALRDRIAGRLA